MAIPRADVTTGQRLKKLEDEIRRIKLMPSVAQSAVAPPAVVKSSVWYDSTAGNAPSYFNGTDWVPVRDETIAVAQATADEALAEAGTNGIAPTASPDPTSLAGIGIFIVKWTPITNPDPVRYQVHVSTTLGFTATVDDPATLVGTTSGSQFTVRALPGPEPDPGDPDPRTLGYDTTYYVRVIALDDDGAAPQSLQAVAAVFRVTGVDLAVDSVTATNIVAGTLTGELFSATVIMAGTFKTAETGQRIEFGIAGITGYKPDGSLMISFPTDGSNALFDGELIVRGATILGGMSVQSAQNESTADSVWTLMRGIVAPSATPQLQVAYDTLQPSTASLSAAQKTNNDPAFGLGGPFDLVASEVSHIEWRTDSGGYFVLHQQRPNGSRAWHFDASGNPVDIFGTGVYFSDLKDWETWSTTVMTTSSAPKNGIYVMFRFIPDPNNTYYLSSPAGINRYSRQNGVAPPCIGNNGTDMYIAEIVNTDDLRVRYFVPDGSGGNMPAPTTTYESTTGYTASAGLCAITNGSFDMGGARYMTAQRNNGTNVRMLVTSGTNANSIFPGGTSNNWGSANLEAETFESPTTNRKGVCWDGTQFWTYSADGFLYKHTAEKWDPAVASSTYWGQLSFYDSDATGGTHETKPGVFKSYTAKRRSKNTLVVPSIPDNGGTDDPDKIRLYMGRGATQPSNANMHLQYEGSTNTAFTTLATATAAPPTSSNFPATNPAKWRNDDDTLVIDGAGQIKGVTVSEGADRVAIRGPYAYCILNGNHSTAGAAFSNVTNWQAEVTASGITLGSGTTLTVPRAGRYKLTIQLAYPTSVTAGSIWADVRKNGTATAALTCVNTFNTAHSPSVGGSKTLTLAANDTLQVRSFKSQAGAVNIVTSAELTFWQLEWVGP